MRELNSYTVNYLKAVRWEKPDWIPAHVSLLPATWRKYREGLEAIVKDHPRLFPWYSGSVDYDRIDAPSYREGTYIDHWYLRVGKRGGRIGRHGGGAPAV